MLLLSPVDKKNQSKTCLHCTVLAYLDFMVWITLRYIKLFQAVFDRNLEFLLLYISSSKAKILPESSIQVMHNFNVAFTQAVMLYLSFITG